MMQLQIDPTQILLFILIGLISLVMWFGRNWMKRIETTQKEMGESIKLLVTAREFEDRFDIVDGNHKDLCKKNDTAHAVMWRQINGHRHLAKCTKIENHCAVEVGASTVAQEGASI